MTFRGSVTGMPVPPGTGMVDDMIPFLPLGMAAHARENRSMTGPALPSRARPQAPGMSPGARRGTDPRVPWEQVRDIVVTCCALQAAGGQASVRQLALHTKLSSTALGRLASELAGQHLVTIHGEPGHETVSLNL